MDVSIFPRLRDAMEMTQEEREYRDAVVGYLRHGMDRIPSAQRDLLTARTEEHTRAMGTHTDAAGGVLMPSTWTDRVRLKLASSWLYAAATVVECTQKYHGVTMTLPTVQGVAQDGGTGSVTSTESTPTVAPFLLGPDTPDDYGPLDLRNMPAVVKVSRRLLEDAPATESLDAVMPRAFARSIAAVMHAQLITGTHSSTTIMGLKQSLVYDAGRTVTSTVSTTATLGQCRSMMNLLSPAYLDGAEWLFHPLAVPDEAARQSTLFGLPYRLNASLDAPATGNKKIAVLWRPENYVIAQNLGGMRITRLDEAFAPNGLVAFQLDYRVDACIDDTAAMAILNLT